MSWKLIGKPQTLKCNHALAAKFAHMEPAPCDRPMRLSNKRRLRQAVIDGRFRTCEWASVYCKETGKTYRVNGKHTSTILSEMNGEAPKDLHVIVEEYHADTLKDVASLYASFDPKSSSRTSTDINVAYASAVPELASIPVKFINLAVTGMTIHFCKGSSQALGAYHEQECRSNLLIEYSGFVQFLYSVCPKSNYPINHIRRGPVAAAIFATWLIHKENSDVFWRLVANEEHADKKHPTRVLASYLIGVRIRTASSSNKSVTSREVYAKCIRAFNAYMENKPTTLQYYADKPVPEVIA